MIFLQVQKKAKPAQNRHSLTNKMKNKPTANINEKKSHEEIFFRKNTNDFNESKILESSHLLT